jgi:hypothetical protein
MPQPGPRHSLPGGADPRSRNSAGNRSRPTSRHQSRRARRQDPWLWTRGRRSVNSAVLVRQVIYRSGTVVLLVVGTVGLLVGHQVFGSASSSRHPDPAAARLTAHVAAHASPLAVSATVATPVPAAAPPEPAPSPTVAIPLPAASRSVPAPSPTVASRIAASAMQPTIASWYGVRPSACYQRGQRFGLPAGIGMWVASRTLACGTVVEVTGPAGTALLLVEDHGPYLHGRDLDLSPGAFRRVAGPLAKGLVQVTYGVDPGASPSP